MFKINVITPETSYRYSDSRKARFAGNIGYKFEGKYIEYSIHSLDDFDKDWTKIYKLKNGEQFFRIRSNTSDISCIGGIIVKINIERGLIYFLSEHGMENDCLDFETRGIKLLYLNLLQS